MLAWDACDSDCVDQLPVLALCPFLSNFCKYFASDLQTLCNICKSFLNRWSFLFSQLNRLVKLNHSPVSPGTRQMLAKTLQNLARGVPEVNITIPWLLK